MIHFKEFLPTWIALGFRSVTLVVTTVGTNLIVSNIFPHYSALAASFVLMQNLLSLSINANALYYSRADLRTSALTLPVLYLPIAIGIVFELFSVRDSLVLAAVLTLLYMSRDQVWKIELNNLTRYCFVDGSSLIISASSFVILLYFQPFSAVIFGILSRLIIWYIGGRLKIFNFLKISGIVFTLEPFVISQVLSVAVSLCSVVWASHQATKSAANFVSFITMLSLGPLAFNYCSRFLNRLDYLGKYSFVKKEIGLIVGLGIYSLLVGAYFYSLLPASIVILLSAATVFQTAVAFIERRLWRSDGYAMLYITITGFALSIAAVNFGYGYLGPVSFSILVFSYFAVFKCRNLYD